MSFFQNIAGLVSQFSSAPPEQVQQAASDHVGAMDAGELADHLKTGAQSMDAGSLGGLAQSLLGALSQHGHDEQQVNDAGVSTSAAQSGDQHAVIGLIEHAQQNPAALKDAAISYITQNPQVVEKFAPDFVKGLLGRFGV